MGIEESLKKIENRLAAIELVLRVYQKKELTVRDIAFLYGVTDYRSLYTEKRFMLPDYGKRLTEKRKGNKWTFSEVVEWNLNLEEHRRAYLGHAEN